MCVFDFDVFKYIPTLNRYFVTLIEGLAALLQTQLLF